jgi:hypothetical protein
MRYTFNNQPILAKASLLGVALSPIIGGAAAYYWSWRSLQWSIGLWGFLEMVFIYLFLPETSHSHSGSIRQLTTPFNFVWINPFSSIWLLRSPNIMAVVCFRCAMPKVLFSGTSKYICDGYGIWYVENMNIISQSN